MYERLYGSKANSKSYDYYITPSKNKKGCIKSGNISKKVTIQLLGNVYRLCLPPSIFPLFILVTSATQLHDCLKEATLARDDLSLTFQVNMYQL